MSVIGPVQSHYHQGSPVCPRCPQKTSSPLHYTAPPYISLINNSCSHKTRWVDNCVNWTDVITTAFVRTSQDSTVTAYRDISSSQRLLMDAPPNLLSTVGAAGIRTFPPVHSPLDIFHRTFSPRGQFPLPFYMVWDISLYHHHHAPIYIKRSTVTVNVYKIDSS